MKRNLVLIVDDDTDGNGSLPAGTQLITDDPESPGDSPPQPDTSSQAGRQPITDALSAEARDKLPVSDFAVPGKRQLPMHDKKHAKLAWTQVSKTEGLTSQEKRQAYRRILARLKKLGIDVTKYKAPGASAKKAVADAEQPVSIEWPEALALDDLRACLRSELEEAHPQFGLNDVYPGLGIVTAWKRSYWDPVKETYVYDNRTYSISYEITSQDDDDGDVDLCNITFGEPKVTLMTPKVIEDEEVLAATGQVHLLTDEAEVRAGRKPLRFRLPGPRANALNSNNRVYPREVLTDAIAAAKPMIDAGQMISYLGHPPRVKRADGTETFNPDMSRRAAKIVNWFMDSQGQTFVDREIIPTEAGKVVEANILARAAIATSMRASGELRDGVFAGRSVKFASSLTLLGDDFVENPALKTTWAQAQMLTDEMVSTLINTAPIPAELTQQGTSPETAAAIADAASDNSPTLPAQTQVTTPETEATMKFRRNEKGELILDELNGTLDSKGNPLTGSSASPAPTGQQAGTEQQSTQTTAQQAQAAGAVLDEEERADLNEWRDERKAEKAKRRVKTFLDDVFEGKETVSLKDPAKKIEKMDLSRFTDPQDIADIRSICDDAGPDEVESTLLRAIAMKDKEIARRTAASKGYGRSSAAGQTTQHAVITDEALPGREHVNKLLEAMDRYGMTTSGNFRPNPALRKANQPIIDAVVGGFLRREEQQMRALLDSVEHFLDADTTTETLLNQPTITPATVALLTQIYWALSWMPMCGGIGPDGFNAGPGSDAGIGLNLRIAVETRQSGARDLRVGELQPIPTTGTFQRWLNFMAEWRKLAFMLTPEAQLELQRGPSRYDALGRQMFAVSQIFSESIDLELCHEHLNASDEYGAVAVAAEAHVDGDLITAAADLRTLGYVPVADGGNIATAIKITEKIPGHNTVQRPIVPERVTRVVQEDGTTPTNLNTLLNPIAAKIGADPVLIRGELGQLDDFGTIGIVDRPGVAGAQYAVDYENGIFLFRAAADSGVQAGAVPALTYSYATNYDVFDLGGSATADDIAIFYDGLLRRIDATAAVMGSQPRFRPPNFAVFDLTTAVFAESARQATQLFKPGGTDISVTASNPNNFGSRGGVGFMKVNTPWRCAGRRILLGQERSTKYGVQLPWKLEGPLPRYVMQAGVPTPTGAKFWYGEQNGVICTPVCFNKKPDDTIIQINHPYRTIKLVGTGTV